MQSTNAQLNTASSTFRKVRALGKILMIYFVNYGTGSEIKLSRFNIFPRDISPHRQVQKHEETNAPSEY
jgi:hypothetical protein